MRRPEDTDAKRSFVESHICNHDYWLWGNDVLRDGCLIELLTDPLSAFLVSFGKLWNCLSSPHIVTPKDFLKTNPPRLTQELFTAISTPISLFTSKLSVLVCVLRIALWALFL